MKKETKDEAIRSLILLKARMIQRQDRINNLYKDQIDYMEDLLVLTTDHELREGMEKFYIDALEIVRGN